MSIRTLLKGEDAAAEALRRAKCKFPGRQVAAPRRPPSHPAGSESNPFLEWLLKSVPFNSSIGDTRPPHPLSLSLSLSLSLLSAPSTFLRPPASPARLRVAQLGLHALPQGRLPGGPHRQDSLARCASPPPSLAAAAAAAAAPLVFGMVVAHIGGVASACEMSNIVRFFAAFGFA